MDTDFLKNTFSKVIQDYDAARPGYPQELYEIVTGFAKIGAGATILEVGAGTGQATDLFLQGKFSFDLLEVSEEQVTFLKKKYGDVETGRNLGGVLAYVIGDLLFRRDVRKENR